MECFNKDRKVILVCNSNMHTHTYVKCISFVLLSIHLIFESFIMWFLVGSYMLNTKRMMNMHEIFSTGDKANTNVSINNYDFFFISYGYFLSVKNLKNKKGYLFIWYSEEFDNLYENKFMNPLTCLLLLCLIQLFACLIL